MSGGWAHRRKELETAAISLAGGSLLSALLATVRFEFSGAEHYASTWGAGKPVVFVLWHGRLLPSTYYHRQQRLATLISQHRDGEYITAHRGTALGLRGRARLQLTGRGRGPAADRAHVTARYRDGDYARRSARAA